MLFRQLFDRASCTYTYLLACERTQQAVLIDPVVSCVARDERLLSEFGLTLRWVLETHVHADHVTGSATLRSRLGGESVVSASAGVVGASRVVCTGDQIAFGDHHLEARETPGHTLGCVSYVLEDQSVVFTGDALFVRGCGRTDFQGGSATTLYRSVYTQLFTLPDTTKVYPGHDYKGNTVSTIGEERLHNPRLGGGRDEAAFVAIMGALDLSPPEHIDVALPANLRGGAS